MPYQQSNSLILELEVVALQKVLRNVTSNLRLPSVRYLKNILNQKSQNFSDQLIKEVKIKLGIPYFAFKSCIFFFLKKKLQFSTS